jgi:hypothetical protein
MPRASCQSSKRARASCQLASIGVGVFFVNTEDGRVATRTQLVEAGLADEHEKPLRPWHPIQGPSDASTMWYSVLRKRERGIFIGTLCFRHPDRLTLLQEQGWEEIPVEEIGVQANDGH